jgi:hypothetical protein
LKKGENENGMKWFRFATIILVYKTKVYLLLLVAVEFAAPTPLLRRAPPSYPTAVLLLPLPPPPVGPLAPEYRMPLLLT